MKFLNVIDLVFQTFILGAVSLLSLALAFTGGLETIGMIALYGAVFLGPWQLVSSVLTTIARGLYFRWRVIHLIGSGVYMAGFALLAWWSNSWGDSDNAKILFSIAGFIGFLIPVGLALFYYFITVKSFQFSRTKPK
jgi:hypothetical protein